MSVVAVVYGFEAGMIFAVRVSFLIYVVSTYVVTDLSHSFRSRLIDTETEGL